MNMADYLNRNNHGRYYPLGKQTVRKPFADLKNLPACDNKPRKPQVFEIYQDWQCDKENVCFKPQRTSVCEKVQLPVSVGKETSEECIDDENESPGEQFTELVSFQEEEAEISAITLPKEDDASVSLLHADDTSVTSSQIGDISSFSLPEFSRQLYKFENEDYHVPPFSWEDSLNDSALLVLKARKDLYNYAEYSKDVYDYLREFEMKRLPLPTYMQKQPDITSDMRSILVDWLVDVALENKMNNETLHLAVSLVDRFLSVKAVSRSDLQLVGTAAMFIAGKYEEIYSLTTEDYVDMTADTYTKDQIYEMERAILTDLDFNINVPTINCFLQYICCATDLPRNVLFLAQYLCELTLLQLEPFLQFLPSKIAAAAIAFSNYTMDYITWDAELEKVTGYKLQDLVDVMDSLHVAYRNAPHIVHQAIRIKYNSTSYNGVSSKLPPVELLCF